MASSTQISDILVVECICNTPDNFGSLSRKSSSCFCLILYLPKAIAQVSTFFRDPENTWHATSVAHSCLTKRNVHRVHFKAINNRWVKSHMFKKYYNKIEPFGPTM